MSNANDFVIENGVLTKYVGSGGDVVIPEGVNEIGAAAFYMCRWLNTVLLHKQDRYHGHFDWQTRGHTSDLWTRRSPLRQVGTSHPFHGRL